MFWLALKRYSLDVAGDEAFYTFLYLTRDTFSPWENLALLLQNYDKIDFQGLAPIVRDFYVFIPTWLWPDRPRVVLNTANYFTWEVLNNHSGLAISPTLIGSLVVMGGALFIPLGAILVGMIIKWFDWLYELGKTEPTAIKRRHFAQFLLWCGVQYDRAGARRAGLFRVARGVLLHYFRRLSGAGEVAVLAVSACRADSPARGASFIALCLTSGPDGKYRPMETKISVPRYALRGIDLHAFADMASFLHFLLPDGKPRKTAARWWPSTRKRC